MNQKNHINVQPGIQTSVKIYGRLPLQLWRKSRLEANCQSTVELAEWVINRKRNGEIAKSTWRGYRAALMPILSGEALRLLQDETPQGARSRGERKRTKHVNDKMIARLKRALADQCPRSSKVPDRLLAWVEAGTITGLRPMEWATAKLGPTHSGWVLVVKNAKHSHDRAHGEKRKILLCTDEAMMAVRRHLEHALAYIQAKPGRTYRMYYTACRAALAKVNRTLPKSVPRITFYSARHQFKINARKADTSRDELAYLMGHAATGTAQRHYGRPGAKGGGFPVRAHGEPENPIRQTHRQKPDGFIDPKNTLSKARLRLRHRTGIK